MKPDLEAIEARANAASEGPWILEEGFQLMACDEDGEAEILIDPCLPQFLYAEDAEFIAHARQDIPDLLAHMRELEEKNEKLRWSMQSMLVEADHAKGQPACECLPESVSKIKCWFCNAREALKL